MTHLHRSSRALPPVARAGLAALLAFGAGSAFATEYGIVTAVTPAARQVTAPRRECWQQDQVAAAPTTGAGALAGAVVGGVLGHGLGGGPVGTAIGAVIGAGVGDNAEAAGTPPVDYRTTRCRDVATTRSQPVYDVQYDYNGTHYSVKMASDPGVGARIPLDVTAQDALPPEQASDGTTVVEAPPARVVHPYPAYPYAYADGYGYAYPAYGYAYPAYGYVYPRVTVGIAPHVWIGGRWGWGWHRGR